MQGAVREQPQDSGGVGPNRMCRGGRGCCGRDPGVITDEACIAEAVEFAGVSRRRGDARVRRDREGIRAGVVRQEGGVDVQIIGVGGVGARIKPTAVNHTVRVHRDSREEMITGGDIVKDAWRTKGLRAGTTARASHKVDLRRARAGGLRAVNQINVPGGIAGCGRADRERGKTVDAIAGRACAAPGKRQVVENGGYGKRRGEAQAAIAPRPHRQIMLALVAGAEKFVSDIDLAVGAHGHLRPLHGAVLCLGIDQQR